MAQTNGYSIAEALMLAALRDDEDDALKANVRAVDQYGRVQRQVQEKGDSLGDQIAKIAAAEAGIMPVSPAEARQNTVASNVALRLMSPGHAR